MKGFGRCAVFAAAALALSATMAVPGRTQPPEAPPSKPQPPEAPPMAFIGVTAKTPEAVNTWGFMIILPLTFASSVFARPSSMPGWLQAFVNVNPITKVVNATRSLMLGGPVAHNVVASIIWLIVIVAVFAPLAVGRYRRRV